MLPLIPWGLPGGAADAFLFDNQPPWPADRYDAARRAQQLRERVAGADTDLNPLADRDRPRVLTGDEAAVGEILLRYRLYSNQPDEMITFRALQRMNPRGFDFDPKLFQYGGAYIYSIGGFLGLAHVAGGLRITGDLGFYLDHPEQFGRFYVVGRVYSLAFAALALVAVFRLAGRAGGTVAAWSALVLAATCPLLAACALEAKPHVPAACVTLWAVERALRYSARPSPRVAIQLGLLIGLAAGLVLTGIAAALLLPALLVVLPASRRRESIRHLGVACGIAVIVYLVTNPYVPLNILKSNSSSLASNLDNSLAMYSIGRFAEGGRRVAHLLIEGCGAAALLLAAGGTVVTALRHRERAAPPMLLTGAFLALCVAIGAGKPAEFARFLLIPALLLCCAAGAAIGAVVAGRSRAVRTVLIIVVCGGASIASGVDRYWRAFSSDLRFREGSRGRAASWLAGRLRSGEAVGVLQEPAPYSMPPIHFAAHPVILMPRGSSAIASAEWPDWLIFTSDEGGRDSAPGIVPSFYETAWTSLQPSLRPAKITWADKPVTILRRVDR